MTVDFQAVGKRGRELSVGKKGKEKDARYSLLPIRTKPFALLKL